MSNRVAVTGYRDGREVYVLGFSVLLAISAILAVADELLEELKRAEAGVRLPAKAVMGRRLGRTKRGAIAIVLGVVCCGGA